jgi:hypothetical protein
VTYALIPPGGFFVRGSCTGLVADFDFEELGEVLLVCGGAAEVSFAAVVGDGYRIIKHTVWDMFYVKIYLCLSTVLRLQGNLSGMPLFTG